MKEWAADPCTRCATRGVAVFAVVRTCPQGDCLIALALTHAVRSCQHFLLANIESIRTDPYGGSSPCSGYHSCLASIVRRMDAQNSHSIPPCLWE